MSFCHRCGSRLEEQELETESRPRLVCTGCGSIHYLNPKIVAATVPVQGEKVVLLRRGIEPRKGSWTFPAGFMEIDETAEEAAIRETKEETNLDVAIDGLLGVYSRSIVGIVVIVYMAHVTDGEPALGPETLEVDLFSADEIPWDELSFETTVSALRDWANLAPTPGL